MGKGNIANLKPWKPGQSGNPKGRPKRKTLTERFFEQLGKELDDGSGEDIGDALVKAWVAKATTDFSFAKEILDRIDGPVPQRHAGLDGGAIRVMVQYADVEPIEDHPDPPEAACGPEEGDAGGEAI